ncbi:MAG: DUF362 domain-containing protein [Anaerolineae bacterium]
MIDSASFPGRGKVAVLRTAPESVLDDIGRLMHMLDYQAALPKDVRTFLKVNISWQQWYPACSSTPWQLEGTIRTLIQDGYSDIVAAHNRTVVVDAYVGEVNNKHRLVTDRNGIPSLHLYEPEVEWVTYEPKQPFLVLDRIFPDGVKIPKAFIGTNIIQLPTVKTHVFTTITGAMKNAFGGLLSERRHWTHAHIHETLVDLLMIQQDIHTGIFAVMDGTFAGDGPGPRAMRIHEKDIILASSDQVAIDSVSARLQGFDPMSIPFIRIAHERGLGVGDPKEIEVMGMDISGIDWHFETADTLASRGQKLIYHGPLKPFEKPLLQSPLVPWSYVASRAYYDGFWYPFIGYPRVKEALKSKWGHYFDEYGGVPAYIEPLYRPEQAAAALVLSVGVGLAAYLMRKGLGGRAKD